MHNPPPSPKQHGVILLAVLLFIFIITLGAGSMVQLYQTQTQREKEKQLLFAGEQIRRAIVSYYNTVPKSGVRQPPADLEVLLDDTRSSPSIHHLRTIYADPMTGKPDWVLVPGLGGVIGVHSRSTGVPLKVSGFPFSQKRFEGAASYTQWAFLIEPR